MRKIKSKDNLVTFANHRAEPYFTFVKNGRKTIEGRLRKGNYARVKPGDHIVIWNVKETDKLEVLVRRVKMYKSFEQMLRSEPLKKVLPNVETVKDGVEIYKKFYTKDQEKKFGVVAIGVEKLF